MPALVTHYNFAWSVLQTAPSYLRTAASNDLMAFYWGSLGPDPLFFYHPLFMKNPVFTLGQTMHERRIARTFSVMTHKCAKMQDPSAMAYLLGFCCHYALDRTMHPFVTYVVNYRLDPQYPTLSHDPLHNLCESEMDRIIIESRLKTSSANFRAYQLLTVSKTAEKAASQLLSTAAWKAYGERLSPHTVGYSMRSMLRIHHMLYSMTGRPAHLLSSLEKLTGNPGAISTLIRPTEPLPVDCTNIRREAWTDAATPHMRRYESFFDLLQHAEHPATRLMDHCYHAVQSGSRLPDDLFALNYAGLVEPHGRTRSVTY